MCFYFFLLFVLCPISVRLTPSNGFENAWVLCFNFFFFDQILGLQENHSFATDFSIANPLQTYKNLLQISISNGIAT